MGFSLFFKKKNNYYFYCYQWYFAIQTLQNKPKCTFFAFFSKIILLYEKKALPLHRQTKNKKFN